MAADTGTDPGEVLGRPRVDRGDSGTRAEWQTLPEKTPVAVRRLLRRCLEKDRKGRLADAADARLEIDEALVTEPAASAAATAMARPEARARGRRATVLAGVTLGAAAVAAVTVWVLMRPAPPRVTRTTITPSGVAAVSVDGIGRDVAITPDGTRVVYVGNNGAQLFVRAMDRLEVTALSGLGTRRGTRSCRLIQSGRSASGRDSCPSD